MKNMLFYNSKKSELFTSAEAQNSKDIFLVGNTKTNSLFLNNFLIACYTIETFFPQEEVINVVVKPNFIEIDFSFANKLNPQELQKKLIFSDHNFELINWEKINAKKISIFFRPPFLDLKQVDLKINPKEKVLNTDLKKAYYTNYSIYEKNKQKTQRIQIACPFAKFLIKEDHRQLVQKLNFCSTNIDAQTGGLPNWFHKGEQVKNAIKKRIRFLESQRNYQFVQTPVLVAKSHFQTSGHMDHYQKNMFPPINLDLNTNKNKFNFSELMLRPMSCPQHCLIFNSQKRYQSDLPIRLSENALLFRKESGGSLSGVERTLQMELKDSHIFIANTTTAIEKEIQNCINLTNQMLQDLGIITNRIDLSLSVPDNQDPKQTQINYESEKNLETALQKAGQKFQKVKGEGAFYGPKIDFQIYNANNQIVTLSTIQLDKLTAQKFDMKYIVQIKSNSKNLSQTQSKDIPLIIHHGVFGTYERLLAVLFETHGAFLPFWLAPTQILIITTYNTEDLLAYADTIQKLLSENQLRSEIAKPTHALSKNLSKVYEQGIPSYIVLGPEELKKQNVTYSFAGAFKNAYSHNNANQLTTKIDKFIDKCKQLTLPS